MTQSPSLPELPKLPDLLNRALEAVALLQTIRCHPRRHDMERSWLTDADKVIGYWEKTRTAEAIRAHLSDLEAGSAAAAQAVPGFVLVPRKPTEAMEEAGEAAFFAYPNRSRAHWAAICGDAYRAMLAAAPTQGAEGAAPQAMGRTLADDFPPMGGLTECDMGDSYE